MSSASSPAPVPARAITFTVMDQSGDTPAVYDLASPTDLAVAAAEFDAIIARGYAAFFEQIEPESGEKIAARAHRFDPDTAPGEFVFSPWGVGG